MNTNNFDNPIGNDVNAVSGYLPDVELLTRMINELFSASSSTVAASEAHSPVNVSELEIPTFTADHAYAKSLLSSSPATIPLPFEAELRALSVPAQSATATSAVIPPVRPWDLHFIFLKKLPPWVAPDANRSL